MQHWSEVWSFRTAHFTILAEVTECQDDPADSFDDAETVAEIRAGKYEWFDARVRVLLNEEEIGGGDYLGACAYARPIDLFRDHAGYTAQLRYLRQKHAQRLTTARYWRKEGMTAAPARLLAECARLRGEIGEILKILRNNAMINPPVSYGSYGPDMVRCAIADARHALRAARSIRLREEA